MSELSVEEWRKKWDDWNEQRGYEKTDWSKPVEMETTSTRNFEKEEDPLRCPYCGSTYITANKKGFGLGKALVGGFLTGGVGLLAGFIGSGKVKCNCLKCGQEWKP